MLLQSFPITRSRCWFRSLNRSVIGLLPPQPHAEHGHEFANAIATDCELLQRVSDPSRVL